VVWFSNSKFDRIAAWSIDAENGAWKADSRIAVSFHARIESWTTAGATIPEAFIDAVTRGPSALQSAGEEVDEAVRFGDGWLLGQLVMHLSTEFKPIEDAEQFVLQCSDFRNTSHFLLYFLALKFQLLTFNS
ncbi:MAG: hypothetical protein ACWGQW_10925, partial [bacterium]